MKKIIIILLICTITMFFLSDCKKNQAPVITISKPLRDSIYVSGNKIDIKGEVTDDNGILSGYLSVINTKDSSIIYRYNVTLTNPLTYDFDKQFIPEETDTIPMKVYVRMKDKDGEITKEEIPITVYPW